MPKERGCNMSEEARIMDITNGDEVQGYWETREEAEEWIKEQDFPMNFMIMEER